MTRQQIEELIYGGRMARRFTQDTPILPDVWIEYALHPNEPKPLLLTPWQGAERHTSPGHLSVVVRDRLAAERARTAPPKKGRANAKARAAPPVHVAYNVSTVLVTLTFAEMVRVVLPLSQWWRERVAASGYADQLAALRWLRKDEKFLAALVQPPELVPRRKPRPAGERGAEAVSDTTPQLPPDLLWMLRVAGTIALSDAYARRPKSRRREVPEDLFPRGGGDAPPDADQLDHLGAVVDAAADRLAGTDNTTPRAEPAPADPDAGEVRVHSVSLNRRAATTIRDSRVAVKADSAARLFSISCRDLSWAVIDSGIDARHPAFRARKDDGSAYPEPFPDGKNRTRIAATYDFTLIQYLLSPDDALPPDDALALRDQVRAFRDRLATDAALADQHRRLQRSLLKGQAVDWKLLLPFITIPQNDPATYRPPANEHGTHVAGIIAADWRTKDDADADIEPPADGDLAGIAPDLRLYDLRVLDDKGRGDEFNVIAALQFLRYLKSQKDSMAFHGVNLSLSIRHDVANYACGRTPVCEECERLVGSGIVVVAAAGNDGYQQFLTAKGVALDSFHNISITDPGNAEGVITVGSTHRLMPHTYGVSYFSSRGPTGDGRAKPDLVAPGEKITAPAPNGTLVTLDGTSMAAPHVSGAVALLIARHRELAGQPARIKQVLCRTATDLGRERYFQGAGMVDILRAIQSV